MPFLRKILIFLLLPFTATSQGWQIDLFAGASNYVGDLAPDIVFKETHPAIGVGIKRLFNPYLAGSINLTYGAISGADANTDYLEARNLSFQSTILEISPQFDFNFFKFGTGLEARRFSPYLFTGLSLFKFNPKAEFEGKLYELQPLSTEGQGFAPRAPKPYKLWEVAIPIGAGFKFNLSPHWNLSFSGGYRTAFTDYLDDVGGTYYDRGIIAAKKGLVAGALSDRSGEDNGFYLGVAGKQKGDIDVKDWYIFTGFTISYIIQPPACYSF